MAQKYWWGHGYLGVWKQDRTLPRCSSRSVPRRQNHVKERTTAPSTLHTVLTLCHLTVCCKKKTPHNGLCETSAWAPWFILELKLWQVWVVMCTPAPTLLVAGLMHTQRSHLHSHLLFRSERVTSCSMFNVIQSFIQPGASEFTIQFELMPVYRGMRF